MTSPVPSTGASDQSSDSRGVLLLVAGAGRSGTSTIAGTLNRLGFHVPEPQVPADETNPRGFYEPQWVVDMHKRVLDPIPVRTNDARPVAVDLTARAAESPDLLSEVSGWLAAVDRERIVIKDPRSFWLHELWRRAARATGRDLRFLTMLRHPAEVAGSRAAYYLLDRDEDERRSRETTNVAGWTFGTLVTERLTRGDRRAFVRYDGLMTEWRTTLARVDEQLGLGIAGELEGGGDPPVDDFIDSGLHRVQTGWEQTQVPERLRDIADQVWEAVNVLVDAPHDGAAVSRLDQLYDDYVADFQYALDLTLDQRKIEARYSRAEVRAKQQTRLRRLRERVEALEEENRRLQHRLGRSPRALAGRLVRRLRSGRTS